ncbi:MAG: GNAT family N-acetyltransferase [Pseudomonadota bacterium]
MKKFEIVFDCPASEKRIAELHQNLADAGQALRKDECDVFLLSVVSSEGTMTAGCKGEVAFKSAHISELWVDQRHRGEGLGSELIRSAEKHAIEKGCIRLHLETRNEKARELYERLGYSVFGSLPNYEAENTFYYLEKRLD